MTRFNDPTFLNPLGYMVSKNAGGKNPTKFKLVGFCGTHGTGKTTLLADMVAEGTAADTTQLSRAAQKALGWDSLSRAQESVENMWALQDAILAAMYDRDQAILASAKTVTVVERTPADMWGYTLMWMDRLNISVDDPRARMYKSQCRNMASNYLGFIKLPQHPGIPFVEDPNRADLASRNFVDAAVESFLHDGGLPYFTLTKLSREERRDEAMGGIYDNFISGWDND